MAVCLVRLIWWFVFVSHIVLSTCEVINLNHIADPVFDDFRKRIQEDGLDKVRVSSISEDVRFKILGLNLKLLRFQCENGWVSDISSIQRAGDILMYPTENGIAIEFPFGFNDLQYNCDSYMLDIPIVKFDGKLNGKVGRNEFDLKVLVQFVDEQCTFKIDRFYVRQLDRIKISMTGFSVFNGVLNKVVSRVAGCFKEAISTKVLTELKQSLLKQVEEANLCRQNLTEVRR